MSYKEIRTLEGRKYIKRIFFFCYFSQEIGIIQTDDKLKNTYFKTEGKTFNLTKCDIQQQYYVHSFDKVAGFLRLFVILPLPV